MSTARWIDTAEAAVMLRKTLKSAYPGVKFSVTISRYSGGSSIRIEWTDGPSESKVRATAAPFEGKGFDGMIDMEYSKYSWLLPDGTVTFAVSPGTGDSRGSVPFSSYPKPHPDAELVSFGCYVNETRHISEEKLQELVVEYRKQYPQDPPVEVVPAYETKHYRQDATLKSTDRNVNAKVIRILRELEGDPYYGN